MGVEVGLVGRLVSIVECRPKTHAPRIRHTPADRKIHKQIDQAAHTPLSLSLRQIEAIVCVWAPLENRVERGKYWFDVFFH